MQNETPSQWGILELMGRKVVAGYIGDVGKPLVRIDVPATHTCQAFTQFYGEGSIYAITFTSEEVARKCAEDYRVNPISVYAPSLVERSALEEVQRNNETLRGMVRELQSNKELPSPTTNPNICLHTGKTMDECTCPECMPF